MAVKGHDLVTSLEENPVARVLDAPHFSLLDRLVQRMAEGTVPDDVRQAVDVLIEAADPDRAHLLAVGPDEPTVLVERRAVWALCRTTREAMASAEGILDRAVDETARDRETPGDREVAVLPVLPRAAASLSARCATS